MCLDCDLYLYVILLAQIYNQSVMTPAWYWRELLKDVIQLQEERAKAREPEQQRTDTAEAR